MNSKLLQKVRHWSLKQQLLTDHNLSTPDVLKHIIGVYSTHPSGPLSLLARKPDLTADIFHTLDSPKHSVRIPAMRLSVHMVHISLAPEVFVATVDQDPAVWAKRYSQKGRAIPKDKYASWTKEILAYCDKPRSASDIRKQTGIDSQVIKPVLNRMAFEGHLIRVSGDNLRANRLSYVTTVSWIGRSLHGPTENNALTKLARMYLKTFGPVRIQDFSWWAGVASNMVNKTFEKLELAKVNDEYLLLAEDEDIFNSHRIESNGHMVILPQWDAYTMGYAPDGRQRLVEDSNLKDLYGKIGATGGNAMPCILLDGRAIATWKPRFKGRRMEVSIHYFEQVSDRNRQQVKTQMQTIARLMHCDEVVNV